VLKPFELAYVCMEPLLPPLYAQVRKRLRHLARGQRAFRLLDVGGRKSHYTVGVPARVTITDLERTTAQQVNLNLGVTDSMVAQTYARRSNIERILVDDMTESSLPDASFDCVVAVEVLEHVDLDVAFVQHAQRVLRPGGVFLMTTPNGDWVTVTNPDHRRHYRRVELKALLSACFDDVHVDYAIADGSLRQLGLRSWSTTQPLRTAVTMASNVANRWQSGRAYLRDQPVGTRHLIATARKPCAPRRWQ
jgi:SAM-dependent methyltransferase